MTLRYNIKNQDTIGTTLIQISIIYPSHDPTLVSSTGRSGPLLVDESKQEVFLIHSSVDLRRSITPDDRYKILIIADASAETERLLDLGDKC